MGHFHLIKKKQKNTFIVKDLVKSPIWNLSKETFEFPSGATLEIHPGGGFRKVFVFMGPLSPEGAGKRQGACGPNNDNY